MDGVADEDGDFFVVNAVDDVLFCGYDGQGVGALFVAALFGGWEVSVDGAEYPQVGDGVAVAAEVLADGGVVEQCC